MLISVFESLGQGLVDEYVATAILSGIMSATANFTAPQTTAKAMTMAAQMIAAGAKQQEVVRAMQGGGRRQSDHHPAGGAKSNEPKDVPKDAKSQPVESKAEQKSDEKSDDASTPSIISEDAPVSAQAEQQNDSDVVAQDATEQSPA